MLAKPAKHEWQRESLYHLRDSFVPDHANVCWCATGCHSSDSSLCKSTPATSVLLASFTRRNDLETFCRRSTGAEIKAFLKASKRQPEQVAARREKVSVVRGDDRARRARDQERTSGKSPSTEVSVFFLLKLKSVISALSILGQNFWDVETVPWKTHPQVTVTRAMEHRRHGHYFSWREHTYIGKSQLSSSFSVSSTLSSFSSQER